MPRPTVRFVALAVALGLVLAGCGGEDNDDTEVAGTLVEVKVVGGAPEGGVRRAPVKLDDMVTLRVASDATDEVHVHGYDLEFDVGPGQPGEVVFDAKIPGVFEVELHEADREILKLEVSP